MITARKMLLSSEALRELYEGQGLNEREIGERIGVSRKTVGAWLHLFGISVRRKVPKPTRDELCDLYSGQGLTTSAVGKRLGVSNTCVCAWLRSYGIPRRASGTGLAARGKVPPTEAELQRLIHVEHRSYEDIGAFYGVDFTAINYWRRKYGIPRRVINGGNGITGKVLPIAEDLRAIYDTGVSIPELANRYGLTTQIMNRLFRKFGIPMRENGWDGGKRILCNDGHRVRSVYEQRVCEWLTENRIAHTYEPRLPFDTRYRADFLANGWFIEIWGVKQNPRYEHRRKAKCNLYSLHQILLIELQAHAFNADQNGLWYRRLVTVLEKPCQMSFQNLHNLTLTGIDSGS